MHGTVLQNGVLEGLACVRKVLSFLIQDWNAERPKTKSLLWDVGDIQSKQVVDLDFREHYVGHYDDILV